jgi:hypothetical protein
MQMKEPPISTRDRRRKRAMIVFQILCYGYLLAMFWVQMHMASVRHW